MRTNDALSRVSIALGFGCLASITHAEVGPAMTGLSGNANDAMTVFTSPAGITRLDQSEIVV